MAVFFRCVLRTYQTAFDAGLAVAVEGDNGTADRERFGRPYFVAVIELGDKIVKLVQTFGAFLIAVRLVPLVQKRFVFRFESIELRLLRRR